MHQPQDIRNLYNALFDLESKFKKEAAYPIHKRMNFGNEFNDVYELLLSQIDIQNKTILDAGCGVGFGSFLLAKSGAQYVKGISISEKEIERANAIKNELQINNTNFEVTTFDHTTANQYDIIICVESLKHTLDFEKSFDKLLNGLKPNGTLCIIDDFFDGKENKTSNQFQNDWHLNYLIALSHLKVDTTAFEWSKMDLNKWLYPKSLWKINSQLFFFKILKRNAAFKKLFRGGLLLDKLYAQKQMTYALVQIKRNR